MTEFVTFGETMAVFVPETRGLPRYQARYVLRAAGAESCTAAGMCRLGHSAAWLSRLGDDEMGHWILRAVRAEGVDTGAVVMDGSARTGIALQQTMPGRGGSDLSRCCEESAASRFSAADIPGDAVKNARILYLTGVTPLLSAVCRDAVYHAIYTALKNHVRIAFDPNIRRAHWDYDHSILMRELCKFGNIILLSLDEAERLYDTRDPERLRSLLLRGDDGKLAVLRKETQGAVLLSASEILTVEPLANASVGAPAPLCDVSDAFNAAFLSGILEEKSLADCGRMAAAASACAAQFSDPREGLPHRALLEPLR